MLHTPFVSKPSQTGMLQCHLQALQGGHRGPCGHIGQQQVQRLGQRMDEFAHRITRLPVRRHVQRDRQVRHCFPQRAEQIVAEGLRLYPPVWVTSRMAGENYEYRGVQIRKGTFLLAPQIAVHRDPRFWEDPLRFDPSRFTKEAKAGRPKLAYFPFGAGSRQCIGEGLAWMEGVLALAVMAQGWRFSLPDGAARSLAVKPSVTLRPKGPVKLRLERR